MLKPYVTQCMADLNSYSYRSYTVPDLNNENWLNWLNSYVLECEKNIDGWTTCRYSKTNTNQSISLLKRSSKKDDGEGKEEK